MNKLSPYLKVSIIILIFTLGVSLGVSIDRVYISRNLPHFLSRYYIRRIINPLDNKSGEISNSNIDPDKERRQKEGRERFLNDVDETVNLSKEQREKITAILDSNKNEMDTIRFHFLENMKQIFTNTDKKILEILSNDQKKMFREKFIDGRPPQRMEDKPPFMPPPNKQENNPRKGI